MFDNDYTFGNTTVYCDGVDCKSEENIEGFDGHPLPFKDVATEIKKLGWIVKYLDGEFYHFCCKECANP